MYIFLHVLIPDHENVPEVRDRALVAERTGRRESLPGGQARQTQGSDGEGAPHLILLAAHRRPLCVWRRRRRGLGCGQAHTVHAQREVTQQAAGGERASIEHSRGQSGIWSGLAAWGPPEMEPRPAARQCRSRGKRHGFDVRGQGSEVGSRKQEANRRKQAARSRMRGAAAGVLLRISRKQDPGSRNREAGSGKEHGSTCGRLAGGWRRGWFLGWRRRGRRLGGRRWRRLSGRRRRRLGRRGWGRAARRRRRRRGRRRDRRGRDPIAGASGGRQGRRRIGEVLEVRRELGCAADRAMIQESAGTLLI